jgi:predicted DCC family thiol-disulfide oxidoreductase YuxK
MPFSTWGSPDDEQAAIGNHECFLATAHESLTTEGGTHMQKLYVFYDPKCELCCRLRNWILVQRSWIGLAVIEAGSDKAKRLFPELERIATLEDLAVISDEGAVYLNDRAWIMVLFAMVEYRDWAARLSHPLLMSLARQAFAALSKNRHYLSRWLSAEDPEAIAGELRKIELQPCAVPTSNMPSGNMPASNTPSDNRPLSSVREYLQ